jgi:FkbM family methyltransferase
MNPYRLLASGHEKSLFLFLLRLLKPDLVMDVGSRNGREALTFRQTAPAARVVAIEANPELYSAIRSDPQVIAAGIEVLPFAASDRIGRATFSIFNERKGTGSLRRKTGNRIHGTFEVETRRLDELTGDAQRIALWLDVEGAAHEALDGCAGAMSRVVAVHAEVEAVSLFDDQKTRGAVDALMAERGFAAIDGGVPAGRRAGNVVYLRADLARRPGVLAAVLAYKLYVRARLGRRAGPQPKEGAPGAGRSGG